MDQNMMGGMEHKKPVGPTIGIIIILIVIILGGFYFWQSNKNTTPAGEIPPSEEAKIQELETQSSSDDLSSIEADLEATNFDDLDAGIEAELQ